MQRMVTRAMWRGGLGLLFGAGLLAGMALAQPAEAETVTGLDLLRQCEGGTMACLNYMSGFIAGHQLHALKTQLGVQVACFPATGIGNEQLKLVMEKYLRDHPQYLHVPANALIWGAVLDAFPCPR
jgi:hypothetical protein